MDEEDVCSEEVTKSEDDEYYLYCREIAAAIQGHNDGKNPTFAELGAQIDSKLDDLLTGTDDLAAQVDYLHTASQNLSKNVVPGMISACEDLPTHFALIDKLDQYSMEVAKYVAALEDAWKGMDHQSAPSWWKNPFKWGKKSKSGASDGNVISREKLREEHVPRAEKFGL